MLMGVLIDYIANIWARLDNHSNFLPAESFRTPFKDFNDKAKDLLLEIYPEVNPKHTSTMMNIIKGLNRRPFSWKLSDLRKNLPSVWHQGKSKRLLPLGTILHIKVSF